MRNITQARTLKTGAQGLALRHPTSRDFLSVAGASEAQAAKALIWPSLIALLRDIDVARHIDFYTATVVVITKKRHEYDVQPLAFANFTEEAP